ncbi:TPA: hypothetical protein ACIUAX_004364 [Salmonella enterica subsp. enterica serovar Virchow]
MMPTTCKTVFVVHEIGGKAYGCVVGKTLSRLFFLSRKIEQKTGDFAAVFVLDMTGFLQKPPQ